MRLPCSFQWPVHSHISNFSEELEVWCPWQSCQHLWYCSWSQFLMSFCPFFGNYPVWSDCEHDDTGVNGHFLTIKGPFEPKHIQEHFIGISKLKNITCLSNTFWKEQSFTAFMSGVHMRRTLVPHSGNLAVLEFDTSAQYFFPFIVPDVSFTNLCFQTWCQCQLHFSRIFLANGHEFVQADVPETHFGNNNKKH